MAIAVPAYLVRFKVDGTARAAGDTRKVVMVCAVLTALIWLVFGQTLGHQFINFDDKEYVYENVHVRSGLSFQGIIHAFTGTQASLWHPLTTITHMLDCQLYGLRPWGHHLTNVLLHNIAAVGLCFVLWRMTMAIWPSAFVAAVFAIHPMRVESVAWVAERKDVLSAVFFMLTLAAYAHYARKPSFARYLTMSIFFVCGLLSKATFVTMPVVLLLLDYWPLQRSQKSEVRGQKSQKTSWRELILEKIPLFVLSAGAATATVFAQTVTMPTLAQLPLLPRIKNALVSIVIYIRQTLWPSDLGIFYPHPHDQLNGWLVFGSAALIVGISVLVVLVRRKHPYVLVGWFWYIVLLAPVLGIVQAGLQGHADRFTYLPHIGLTILVAWSVADLTQQWRHRELVLGVAGSAIIVVLTLCAWRQATFWQDSVSIWTRTLAVTSHNATAHQNLGAALWARGQEQEAVKHSRTAEIIHLQTNLKDHPLDVGARNNLGVLLFQSGDARPAIEQWQTSLQIDPNDGNAQNNLAWVLATCPEADIRDGRRAVELAEKAVRLPGGDTPMVLRTLAAAYAEAGDFSRATETAQRAADLAVEQQNPSLAETLRREIALYRANTPYREAPRQN